ncbi:MAG: RelA/SpoT family protein [Candidatus Promineifilaceae bacterium]
MSAIVVATYENAFFDQISYLTEDEQHQVTLAYAYAREQHGEELRKSGEPYYTHPLTVAYYLAEYNLDAPALMAALLHDVAEDCDVTIEDISELFGKDVGQIVDGVTKFEQSEADIKANGEWSREQKSHATIEKLFRYMVKDARVVLIKLYDRLHNMRTIQFKRRASQLRSARETLGVYAPLAHRLGMWKLRNELQSLSLEVIDHTAYRKICRQFDKREREQARLVQTVSRQLLNVLEANGIYDVKVWRSVRNPFSVYLRDYQQGASRYEVDRLTRLQISVPDRAACYAALGIIHGLWKPKPNGFNDYIARPRENLYKALHTDVIHPSGKLLKLRIRSQAMNIVSEIGILGTWAGADYQMSAELARDVELHVGALRQSISHNIEHSRHHSRAIVDTVVGEVLGAQITAYTPDGEPFELPAGATPLDFAFKIHTQVGETCQKATVNEELAPLNMPLQDGDLVKIWRKPQQMPLRLWLDPEFGYLRTSYAESRVRRFFRRLPEKIATRQGRGLLEQELSLIGMASQPHRHLAELMGFDSAEKLYLSIGHAETLQTDVARRVLSTEWHKGAKKRIGRAVFSKEAELFIILGAIELTEALHLCGNCKPRPGDKVRGYVRKNRYVTVHKHDCHQLPHQTISNRVLSLRWGDENIGEVRQIGLQVKVFDRPNLLLEIAQFLRTEMMNISWIYTPKTGADMRLDFVIDTKSPRQLVALLHKIQTMPNVRKVQAIPNPKFETVEVLTSGGADD